MPNPPPTIPPNLSNLPLEKLVCAILERLLLCRINVDAQHRGILIPWNQFEIIHLSSWAAAFCREESMYFLGTPKPSQSVAAREKLFQPR
jgi:hypothetical protein